MNFALHHGQIVCLNGPLRPAPDPAPPDCMFNCEMYREETGTGLYLPGVPTIVYTTPDAEERQSRVRSRLRTLKFRNWSFHYGIKDHRHYLVNTRLDWARILRSQTAPFLMLEDDIEPREFHAYPNLPACDIAYLGGGRQGAGRQSLRQSSPSAQMAYQYAYESVDDRWMRVWGMLYCHAVLFLENAAMQEVADLLERHAEAVDGVDGVLHRVQHLWTVLCAKRPFLWQNDGHHYHDTYDYGPEPTATRCSRFSPPTSIKRSARQRILQGR